jgi:hypothetical protein
MFIKSLAGKIMFIDEPLPVVKEFINQLNEGLSQGRSKIRLSRTPPTWLGFGRMGMLITHSVGWAKLERASLGNYSRAALS